MKFKITKQTLGFLQSKFDKDDSELAELELEPVYDTAREVVIQQSLQQESYHKGWHKGFKEGYYEAKNRSWKCSCGCGGNNCYLRLCDDKCPLYNHS